MDVVDVERRVYIFECKTQKTSPVRDRGFRRNPPLQAVCNYYSNNSIARTTVFMCIHHTRTEIYGTCAGPYDVRFPPQLETASITVRKTRLVGDGNDAHKNIVKCLLFFLSSLLLSSLQLVEGFTLNKLLDKPWSQVSYPSPPRYVPLFFVAHRVQHFHYYWSIFIECS